MPDPSPSSPADTSTIDDRSVCVVTQPLSAIGESTTRSFLNVLSGVASVSLVTANLPSDSDIHDDFEVTEISSAGTGTTILRAALRYVLNQIKMCVAIYQRNEEIVVFYGATSYIAPIAFSRLVGRTVVLLPRGDVPLTLELQWSERVPRPLAVAMAGGVRLLERVGYRLADTIVTYSPAMADELGLGRYEGKLYTDGARYVDTDKFYPREPYEEREDVVGFLGRLDEEKRIRALAAAAKRLPDDVTFAFVGSGELEGWLQRELTDEIAEGSVNVVGWVDHEDVPTQLSRFRMLVLPSQPTEGLPTVILESFACGTPAYATPVAGVPDVVKDGETGFLMDDTDPEMIADRIERVMEKDLSGMSRRCQELVEAEYSLEAAQRRYDEILSSIMN